MSGWRPIEESGSEGDRPFLARFKFGGNKMIAAGTFYAVLEWDEGRLRYHDEGDTGWNVDEYIEFMPIPGDGP